MYGKLYISPDPVFVGPMISLRSVSGWFKSILQNSKKHSKHFCRFVF